ncbi:MAG: L,D-transpeptidase family protein, partial [Candidatus Binatia bacterium]
LPQAGQSSIDMTWLRLCIFALVSASLMNLLGKPLAGKIVVSKSARSMTVYDAAGRPLKTYTVLIGEAGVGPKRQEGDRTTPEGEYFVCFKNPQSRFHLSLGLSYPNEADARRGLAAGLINEEEYRLIIEANKQKKIPPWKTALGGEIFIHGESSENTTAGCIAVSDREIEEIFPLVELGTPVIITP